MQQLQTDHGDPGVWTGNTSTPSTEEPSYHFVLRPALLDQLGHRLLHQTLEGFARIVAALVQLKTGGGGVRRQLREPHKGQTQEE